MSNLAGSATYQDLLEQISLTYTAGRSAALQTVNTQLVQTYWQVGQRIVEFEQGGTKSQKPSGFLSWSHDVELIRMDDPLVRGG